MSPQEMAKAMSGLKESMEFVLKARVRFGTSFDTNTFRQRLLRANDDFVLLFPSEYQLALEQGYVPIAQLASPLKAYIVVPISSPLQTMAGLNNKLLLFPGNGSPMAELARQAVTSAGMKWDRDISSQSLRTDGACLEELLLGRADACAAFQAPTRIIQQEKGIKLRIIGQSGDLPPPLFVAHSRVPFETREKIRKALLSLDDTGAGKARLRTAGFKRIVAFRLDSPAAAPPPAPNEQ